MCVCIHRAHAASRLTLIVHLAPLTSARSYAAYGNAIYSPIMCIGAHASKWEFTGSAMLRMGKQRKQGKGWHFGTSELGFSSA